MIPKDMLKKIRRVEIHTTHIVDSLMSGQYRSAFKGRGIEFEEVRPYFEGDDVRAIDWNVTARAGDPYIKQFREERELTVYLLVDLSASQDVGTQHQLKRELVAELGATLAFSAIKSDDKVGLILFTDQIEKVVPPGKRSKHVLRVIRELLYCQPIGSGTNITAALDHLNKTVDRRSVVFLISDFQDRGYERALRVARRRHDIIPIMIGDRREQELPNVGLVELADAETGEMMLVDTSSPAWRAEYKARAEAEHQTRKQLLRRLKMDPVTLATGEDFVEPLRRLFHKRGARRAR
ncbi:MAG: DUF58 domain-containing protein [Pirellulales bacterium]|nr:DUF58 domain-containing protein [Pirellulales bacterium]